MYQKVQSGAGVMECAKRRCSRAVLLARQKGRTTVSLYRFPFLSLISPILYTRSCLGDSQDEGAAGSTAAAAKIARVPARSIDLHASATGGGDYSGRNRGLQLLTAGSKSG